MIAFLFIPTNPRLNTINFKMKAIIPKPKANVLDIETIVPESKPIIFKIKTYGFSFKPNGFNFKPNGLKWFLTKQFKNPKYSGVNIRTY